jgi:hypothetical protein
VLVNLTVAQTMLDDLGDRLALTGSPLELDGHILVAREHSGQGGLR